MGKLILIGAGPGDEDHITIKGIKALQMADVAFYDDFSHEVLLDYCNSKCLKRYIKTTQRSTLHKMLASYAAKHQIVVRLTSGDPYISGTGHQELEYALKHGLETGVIPGVSNALAIPALNQVPVTKRGQNHSILVVTGENSDNCCHKDMTLAARSTATVLMTRGINNLPQIVRLFIKIRGKHEPIAILPHYQQIIENPVVGILQDIEQKVSVAKSNSEAYIVIGAVVRDHPYALSEMIGTNRRKPAYNK